MSNSKARWISNIHYQISSNIDINLLSNFWEPKSHYTHLPTHSGSIILEKQNPSSSYAHVFLYFKFIMRGQRGSTRQLATHLLKEKTISHTGGAYVTLRILGPYSIICLKRTSIFDWCVVRWGSKKNFIKTKRLNHIFICILINNLPHTP